MPLSLQVQHYQRIPGTTTVRLHKLTPYLRLCEGGSPPIYLQGGQAWSESAADPIPLEDLPPWFGEALARLTLHARQEVGWTRPGDPPLPVPQIEEALAPTRRGGGRLGRPRE